MKQESQLVVAIKNGTVIDHIPSAKLFEVVNLLHLQDVRDSAIIVGYNLKSKKFGHKSLIKVFDKFFTDAELNQLSVVAPNVTLCIIRDYEVVEKKSVTLPEELRGIVRCNNPKCITNNEPMQTVFHVSDRENGLLRCHYCGKEQHVEDVKVIEYGCAWVAARLSFKDSTQPAAAGSIAFAIHKPTRRCSVSLHQNQ